MDKINTIDNRMTVKDIMVTKVEVAYEDEPLIEVARRIIDKDFNGLPVVDPGKRVIGIVTQYDLVSKGTAIHIPTFIQMLQNLPVLSQEKNLLRKEIEPILKLKVKDVMNPDPLMIKPDQDVSELPHIFAEHHKVNPIPVVNDRKELVGIVSRHDMVKFLAGPGTQSYDRTKPVDSQIADFMETFQKRFAVTTKSRANHWLFFSVLFTFFGFLVAFALIFRFVIK